MRQPHTFIPTPGNFQQDQRNVCHSGSFALHTTRPSWWRSPVTLLMLFTLTTRPGAADAPAPGADSTRPASRSEVVVGGRNILLPAPAGFARVDGLDPDVDRTVNAMLPASNRYIARFDPPATDTTSAGRSFNAQVQRALESREIGARTFSEVKQDMKAEISRMEASIAREIAKFSNRAEQALQDATDLNAAFSLSDVVMLGCFDDSPESLGFTMAMNVAMKAGDVDSKTRGVIAAVLVPVNGRLIYLYANSDYRSESDRQWAEKAVAAWRDAVVAANPRVEGPPGKFSIFNGTLRSALIGGMAGGVIGLVMALFRKFKKKA